MKKRRIASWLLASLLCMTVWLPLLMMISNSFMERDELLYRFGPILNGRSGSVDASFLPDYPTLRPYVELLFDSPGFFVMFWNSVLQTGGVLFGQSLMAIPAAWAFGVFEFPGKKGLSFLYLLLMVLPFQVMMAPDYLVLHRLHLLDTHLGVILPAVWSTFPVFIMSRFFSTIPRSLFESARLDGAGEWAIFWHIGLPVGYPGILAAAALSLLDSWNAIEPAMAFLRDPAVWPLALYLPDISKDNAGVAWAASVIAMAAPLLAFLFGQTYLEQGIVISGLKE